MKLPLVALLCIAASLGQTLADSGGDLLEKVKARYATCQTFSCQGSLTTVSNLLRRPQPFKTEKKFSIRFQRPASLRVDWLEPSASSFTPVACSLYTQNKKYYGITSFQRTPQRFATLEEGIESYAGISGGVTYGIPFLLLGKKGYFSNSTCRLGSDTRINGHPCRTLHVTDQLTGTWVLFIDKADTAILRSRQVHEITAGEIKKIRAETRRTWKVKNIPFPDFPADDLIIETTTDYSSVSFDQKMNPSDFVFHPPGNNTPPPWP